MKTILVSKVFYTFGKNLLQDMDQELKNRIIQNASLLFLQHGIKSVTMILLLVVWVYRNVLYTRSFPIKIL